MEKLYFIKNTDNIIVYGAGYVGKGVYATLFE